MDEKDAWAANLARKVLDRQEKEQLERRSSLAGQERITAKAPEMWDELRAEVRDRAEALNKALEQGQLIQFRQLEMYKFELVMKHGAHRVFVDFNPKTTRLDIKNINNTPSNYEIRILNETLMWIHRNVGSTSQQIAKEIFEDAALYV